MTASHDWSADVFAEIKRFGIETVCTVPDGGLTRLLNKVERARSSLRHGLLRHICYDYSKSRC